MSASSYIPPERCPKTNLDLEIEVAVQREAYARARRDVDHAEAHMWRVCAETGIPPPNDKKTMMNSLFQKLFKLELCTKKLKPVILHSNNNDTAINTLLAEINKIGQFAVYLSRLLHSTSSHPSL